MIEAVESEFAILGAALYDREACAEMFERVKPEHFFEPTHGRLWAQMQTAAVADPILIARRMADDPGLESLGGLKFLADLVDKAALMTAPAHADAVLDASMRRQLHAVVSDAAVRAQKEPCMGSEIIADLERHLADIARERAPVAVPVGVSALSNMEAAWRGDFAGAATGLSFLDHVTGGIRQDDVWFFGGRTSMGKSVLGLELALGLATHGRAVLIFSLEMPLREVQMRLIASLAHDPYANMQVRYGDLLKGRTPEDLKGRARAAARRLAELPIVVNDMGGLTIADVRAQALRQVRAWEKAGLKPGAILIDHIGLVNPNRRTDSKAADTSDTVNELKPLAKQLRCPVIALAQVNRATEGRTDKRPTLGDLNWSGAIEQIADFIGLLYRESYYLARSTNREEQTLAIAKEHDLDILIHKNRSGPICNLRAWVDVACNTVRDMPEERRA